VPVKENLPNTEKTAAVDIYLVDIDKGRVLPEKHHVILPKDVYLWGMELSHSGDRIAWLFGTQGHNNIGRAALCRRLRRKEG
jgi:hypothetical protein